MKPKTYKEMMTDMIGSIMSSTPPADLVAGSIIKELMKALEKDMFESNLRSHEKGLIRTLKKLGIKSARDFSRPLQMEGLDSMLKNATFDASSIKRWQQDGGK